jgi:hypothetical protein
LAPLELWSKTMKDLPSSKWINMMKVYNRRILHTHQDDGCIVHQNTDEAGWRWRHHTPSGFAFPFSHKDVLMKIPMHMFTTLGHS